MLFWVINCLKRLWKVFGIYLVLKGLIIISSSYPPYKDGNTRFTIWKQDLIKYDFDVFVSSKTVQFLFLRKWIAHSLFIRSKGEIQEINIFRVRFMSQENVRFMSQENVRFMSQENVRFMSQENFRFMSHFEIRERFQGYRSESGFAILAWRVSWNYTYSPFNKKTDYNLLIVTDDIGLNGIILWTERANLQNQRHFIKGIPRNMTVGE